jgi:hypothetical protein
MSAFPTAHSTDESYDDLFDYDYDEYEDYVDNEGDFDDYDPDELLLEGEDDGIIDLHWDAETRSFRV